MRRRRGPRSRRPAKDVPLVLVAEDHGDVRAMYVEYFEAHGFRTLAAPDGLTTYNAVVTTRPDVVVMDLSLPQLDGWEVTRRLKRNPTTAHIPIIACTRHVLGQSVERALVAGCDAYITKPCPPEVLLREVRRLLHRFADRGRRQHGGSSRRGWPNAM